MSAKNIVDFVQDQVVGGDGYFGFEPIGILAGALRAYRRRSISRGIEHKQSIDPTECRPHITLMHIA